MQLQKCAKLEKNILLFAISVGNQSHFVKLDIYHRRHSFHIHIDQNNCGGRAHTSISSYSSTIPSSLPYPPRLSSGPTGGSRPSSGGRRAPQQRSHAHSLATLPPRPPSRCGGDKVGASEILREDGPLLEGRDGVGPPIVDHHDLGHESERLHWSPLQRAARAGAAARRDA